MIYIILFCIIVPISILLLNVWTRIQQRSLKKKIDSTYSHIEHKFEPQTNHSSTTSENAQIAEILQARDNFSYIDIRADLEKNYNNQFILLAQRDNFIHRYSDTFQEARSLNKRLNALHIRPSETILRFIREFDSIRRIIQKHNEKVANLLLLQHKDFFDHCLSYPLDQQQRRSIISEEDNCLVVSSAGSGKTSSIVGKVKYLTEIKGVDPKKILLISYTNKAAAELTDRMNTNGLQGYTFHKLAIDLIGKTTGIKPSIYDKTNTLFINIYHDLLKEPAFKKDVVNLFMNYPTTETYWEQQKRERREQLSALKRNDLTALFPDMDGKTVQVRSEQERTICFILTSLGVQFRYEEQYEHPVADGLHAQYKPDFSIYYEQNGKKKRLYLEHFGVDEHGLVPSWFAKEKQMTYDEANRLYNDGIAWKKSVHQNFGTDLITTFSNDFKNGNIKNHLKELLTNAGVPVYEKNDTELYNALLPNDSQQEKAFIRLVASFVTLLKSCCKSIQNVLKQAYYKNDERSIFLIEHIFLPIYERYVNTLNECNQIDFTDAILQATKICNEANPIQYDYIIVDEFQDISLDRYEFLKALRKGKQPAKLYCVGDDWQSIYRFSGSDITLLERFSDYFGRTETHKIETTYRFGNPLVDLSSKFIQRNNEQIKKDIQPFNFNTKTNLVFHPYERKDYCITIEKIIADIPSDKSIFLLGRYTFDNYYLSFKHNLIKKGDKTFYIINGREIEFLTIHKSKGLEADYVILLQCNYDICGFPTLISDDPVLHYVLNQNSPFPFDEERRVFYVAITRAKIETIVLYDNRFPSAFVKEFLNPEQDLSEQQSIHPNANKRWTRSADRFLLDLHREGKSIKEIARKMGRSQTSIIMRLGKLDT